eukprot:8811679-Karenia_brevis.AAC.1
MWGAADLLDAEAADHCMPARLSEDPRPVSAHGRRLFAVLDSLGLLLNGMTCMEFDGSCTRLPTSNKDCLGVLDYIIGPPSMMPHL